MNAKKILLIDDEKLVTDTFSKSLRIIGGYDVTCINKVEDIYTHLENNGRYDLILLDLMMENTDGFEILHNLREDEAKYQIDNVPIVMWTNVSSPDAQKQAEDLKVAKYLVKTDYPANKLVEVVDSILKSTNEGNGV